MTLRARLEGVIAAHPCVAAWDGRLLLGRCAQGDGDLPWAALDAPGDPRLDAWLARESACEAARLMDARAAGAYLMGRLSYALSVWLVRLHEARHLPHLSPECFGAALRIERWEFGTESGEVPVADLWLDPDGLETPEPSPRAVGDALVALMRPVVAGLHRRAKLAPAALWRISADSLAYAFLEAGQARGDAPAAIAEAREAMARPSPLWNPQLRFVEIVVPAEGAHPAARAWFRLRGGCCRYHTLEGGEYCTTCVHRDDASREALLRDHLRESAA